MRCWCSEAQSLSIVRMPHLSHPPHPWLEVFAPRIALGSLARVFFTILKSIEQTSGHLFHELVQTHNVEISHLIRFIY